MEIPLTDTATNGEAPIKLPNQIEANVSIQNSNNPSIAQLRPKPIAIPPRFDAIPEELKQRRQWVVWRYELDGGKWTKVPVNARALKYNASSTNPKSWSTFEQAKKTYLIHRNNVRVIDGIGYVFSKDDPFCGVDLDHCFDGAEGEKTLKSHAQDWVQKFASYTELSVSGEGLHIIVKGKPSHNGKDQEAAVEIYGQERFFTFTGFTHPYGDKPLSVGEAQETIDAFVAQYFSKRRAKPAPVAPEPALGAKPTDQPKSEEQDDGEGAYETWDALRAELGRLIMAHPEARLNGGGKWDCRGICHDGQGLSGLLYNQETNQAYCNKGCDQPTILEAFGLPEAPTGKGQGDGVGNQKQEELGGPPTKADEKDSSPSSLSSQPLWPEYPDKAFYGLAGRLVKVIEPSTEADPVALLIQFLVAFGNLIGRTAFFVAEADRHYCNLFRVLVGLTSKGRKGTSWGQVENALRGLGEAEEQWLKNNVKSGLASGEGLIWAVRDPIEKSEPVREKGKATGTITGYQTVIVDQGVGDKRLLVMEAEFASVLKVMAREGNTASALIRQAWDSGDLRSMTKNSPAQATGAHISMVGHVTRDELRRYLESTEMANGFANRIQWHCSRRSKFLPEGGHLDQKEFKKVQEKLAQVITWVEVDKLGLPFEVKRDEDARALWVENYWRLSEGKPGLQGAITGRAEAQVMRLATIYAVLDKSETVRREHLEAALALWEYSEQSVRFIFGDSMGDPVADSILAGLRGAGEAGLSRSQIRDLFKRHETAAKMERALQALASAGMAHSRKEATGGKPVEMWFAVGYGATKATEATEADSKELNAKNARDESATKGQEAA